MKNVNVDVICSNMIDPSLDDQDGLNLDGFQFESLGILRDAAENGNGTAAYLVGRLFFEGWSSEGASIAVDKEKAVDYFCKGAELGNAYAQRYYATCLHEGIGGKTDNDAAFQWLVKAADQGDAHALYELASIYLTGGWGQPVDLNKALSCCKAIEKKNIDANEGDNVYLEFAKGHSKFLPAIIKGDRSAMLELSKYFKEEVEDVLDGWVSVPGYGKLSDFWREVAADPRNLANKTMIGDIKKSLSHIDARTASAQIERNQFSFTPHETTDKQRIMELLAPIVTSETPATRGCVPLVSEDKSCFTSLGKAVAECTAVKATEFPFLRIFHIYKKRTEERRVREYLMVMDSPEFYPADNALEARKRFKDIWNDDAFFALYENKNGEIASTCMTVNCPECKGSGKKMYYREEGVRCKDDCSACNGTGFEGAFVCKKCGGKGWHGYVKYIKRKTEGTCDKCHGSGKLKSILEAEFNRDDEDKVVKWASILEHDPKLHKNSISAWDLSWDRLKDERFKNAVNARMIKKITAASGVINPSECALTDLPIANESDRKRVLSECFPKDAEGVSLSRDDSNINEPHLCAFYRQSQSGKEKRERCFGEEIRIVTGTGWVKVDCKYNGRIHSFWIKPLTGDTVLDKRDHLVDISSGRRDYRPVSFGNMPFSEYSSETQAIIKEIKKKGIPPVTFLPGARKGRHSSSITRKTKKCKDAMRGVGCLLAIAAVAGFFIWWWVEGLTMSALPGMWEQAKNMLGGSALGTIAKLGGAVVVLLIVWGLIKGIRGKKGEVSTSPKKRWKFVVLGILFGFFGIHLAYAKRWLLFLLLWAGFITGNVMSDTKAGDDKPTTEVATQQVEPSDKSTKTSTNTISNIGFGVWALLWIGGTLFIKKDGKGNRM